jgi:hypothetical protein
MRKKYFLPALLITLLLSYLFYRSCKRDTLVIAPADYISIPDSCWLYGSINLEKIRKEIAWSTLLNGNFEKLFQHDSTANTLATILKSPDIYSIIEQNNIRCFSRCESTADYFGILFRLNNANTIKQVFKSDSITLQNKQVYTFRTKEGFWLYNTYNLLFVSAANQDSVAACRFFRYNPHATESLLSDSVLLSGTIRTAYIPDSLRHPLLDSTEVSLAVKSNSNELEIDWTYIGIAADIFNQTTLPLPESNIGVYCTSSLADSSFAILQKVPAYSSNYLKQQALFDQVLSAVKNNILTIEFNGWKKMKDSYYVSTMNEEFEMVLQKKDTHFIEPVFRVELKQKSEQAAQTFLKYLQRQGLVSKNAPFKMIYGNFDSELQINKKNSIVIQNKHKTELNTLADIKNIDAACFVQIQPQYITGLSDRTISKQPWGGTIQHFENIKKVTFLAKKNKNGLSGNVQIKFNTEEHPLIQCMQWIKK